MDYDPIKNRLGDMVADRPWLTRCFYWLLQTLFLRAWYVRRELKNQLRLIPPGNEISILDAGTGFGQFAYFLARRHSGVRIRAVDIKEDYLKRAARFISSVGLSPKVSFHLDDLTDLRACGPFNLILSVDVMEHIEEDLRVFENFHRVLAPGGIVVINTPSDQGGSDVHGTGEQGFIGEHVRDGYNREELIDKLRTAGLETKQAIYTYGTSGRLAWRLLIKYPMIMLGWNALFVLFLPFYYLPVFPLGLLLNMLDLQTPNKTGTGLLVVAEKKAA